MIAEQAAAGDTAEQRGCGFSSHMRFTARAHIPETSRMVQRAAGMERMNSFSALIET